MDRVGGWGLGIGGWGLGVGGLECRFWNYGPWVWNEGLRFQVQSLVLRVHGSQLPGLGCWGVGF